MPPQHSPALALLEQWPVPTVAAAVVWPDRSTSSVGSLDHSFRLASIAKMFVGWTILIACEEGTLDLDQPAGQAGCTLRHLLSHAGGYPFDGDEPIGRPGVRRIYSNSGIELAAAALARAAGISFADYQREALLEPLGMSATELRGSPAHGVRSTVADMLRFLAELRAPTLLGEASAAAFRSVAFPGLAGLVPGIGRYNDCPWGLGTEIRGDKQPHWTGTLNSPATFGHFGGAGTLLWVDPGVDIACCALTDRPFDAWSTEALNLWPAFADAVITEAGANG